MALRLGKKKAAAEDFSDASLQSDTVTTVTTVAPVETTPPVDYTTESSTVFDSSIDAAPQTHPETYVEPVRVVVPKRKRPPVGALLGLGALGLLGLGALAWSQLAPAEDTEESAPTPARRPAKPPKIAQTPAVRVATSKPGVKTPVVKATAVKTVAKTTTTKTTTVKTAMPTGTTPVSTSTTQQTTVVTATVPNPQAAATAIASGPRMAAVVDRPAPAVYPPPAAQPGRRADPHQIMVQNIATISPGTTRPAPNVTPAVRARLKALWKQGADAKHRKDYAGARRAWKQALSIAPGYPGFAASIAKLPSR